MNDAINYLETELRLSMKKIDTLDESGPDIAELVRTIAIAKLSECVSKPAKDGGRRFIITGDVVAYQG